MHDPQAGQGRHPDEALLVEVGQMSREIKSEPAVTEAPRLGRVEAREEEHGDEPAGVNERGCTPERGRRVVQVLEDAPEGDDVEGFAGEGRILEAGGHDLETVAPARQLRRLGGGLDAGHVPAIGAQGGQKVAGAAAGVEQATARGPERGEPADHLELLAVSEAGLDTREEIVALEAPVAWRVEARYLLDLRAGIGERQAALGTAGHREAVRCGWSQAIACGEKRLATRAAAQWTRNGFHPDEATRGCPRCCLGRGAADEEWWSIAESNR